MERLIVLQGYKLPCEQVWVDHNEMYSVYDKLTIDIDNTPTELIITEVLEEGLVVESIQ